MNCKIEQVVLGALPLAIATVNLDPSLLPGLELKFLAEDIGNYFLTIISNEKKKLADSSFESFYPTTRTKQHRLVSGFGYKNNDRNEGFWSSGIHRTRRLLQSRSTRCSSLESTSYIIRECKMIKKVNDNYPPVIIKRCVRTVSKLSNKVKFSVG